MSSPAQSPRGTEDVEPAPDQTPRADTEDEKVEQAIGPDVDEIMNRPDDIAYADFEVKEQDRWLPIANVARIMKTALPDNAKIAKEAKECMQECVSEFISFITSEASEKCQQEKRKTVNGEDILFAMTSLGFENYGEALKIYLARYRENLVARGEHGKPVPAGSAAGAESASSSYDGANHNVLTHPMDPTVEGSSDFPYGNPGTGDY